MAEAYKFSTNLFDMYLIADTINVVDIRLTFSFVDSKDMIRIIIYDGCNDIDISFKDNEKNSEFYNEEALQWLKITRFIEKFNTDALPNYNSSLLATAFNELIKRMNTI